MSRQQLRKALRENPYWTGRLAKMENTAKAVTPTPVKPRPLGAYDVPLHLPAYAGEMSERDMARFQLNHWRSMIARSNGRGFRVSSNQSPKRKRPRNPRTGDLDMILNGLAVQARYGADQVSA